jgi:hypothetical protein
MLLYREFQIWMSPDFDEPDRGLVDLMENGPIVADEADQR